MAEQATLGALQGPASGVDWADLAGRARLRRRARSTTIYAFLIAVSLPIILPYFWLVTIAFSAKTGVAETHVLWRSMFVLVPGVIGLWLAAALAGNRSQMLLALGAVTAVTALAFTLLVGPYLHLKNFIFLVEPDFASVVRSRVGEVRGAVQFPNVWHAFGNSLLLAGSQTAIVVTVASLAAYYLSRFQFPGRASMLRSLLVLHAFPVLTLIVPLFLMLHYIGLLDNLFGVVLVLVALELPFAIFIMKGFFDAVPWDIEMSALADGATRRQAFVWVVLPQVQERVACDLRLHLHPRLGGVHLRVHLPDPQHQLDDEPLHVLRARRRDGRRLWRRVRRRRLLPRAEPHPLRGRPALSDADVDRRREGLRRMARIEFRNIGKRFGDVVVIPGMNLAIEDGEFVALLGPSGCGKSTSLLILAGIYLPSSGELLFDGQVVNDVEARDRNVGIVFQSYALYPHMTARDNIMFPLRFKKTPRDEALRRVKAAADLVQVSELLDRKPGEMSGGQQQRVALARALVKEPQLLLLDEPLSNLDATLRLSMRTEIKSLQEKLGVTTILVTHDQIEATTMADRIICMRAGRIEQIGTPDDLYLSPASLFVASFIGSPPINLIRGEARDGAVKVNGAAFQVDGARPAPSRSGSGPSTCASAIRACPGGSPSLSRWDGKSSMWSTPASAMCACSSRARSPGTAPAKRCVSTFRLPARWSSTRQARSSCRTPKCEPLRGFRNLDCA